MNSMRQSAREYIGIRRSLGLKLEQPYRYLMDFVSFLERRRIPYVTVKLAYEWAKLPATVAPHTWAIRMRVVRQFAQHRSFIDPRTEIPPQDLLDVQYRRREPYIYSDQEIHRLLRAAMQLKSPLGLERHTYFTLIGLCACTGLRRCEIIALKRKDVDLVRGILTVRVSKNGKSRLVPLHSSVVQKIRAYDRVRKRVQRQRIPQTESFFITEQGRGLAKCTVNNRFVAISCIAGLRGIHDAHGPRLHDLRHTFAVRTLIRWCRSGIDVDQRLPTLSTYLGHGSPTATYWYFSCVPELMRTASDRLERLRKEYP